MSSRRTPAIGELTIQQTIGQDVRAAVTPGVDEKEKEVAKRMHGLPLQSRWNGTGAPPISTVPPYSGLPALETTHPFHFKMTPSMLLGPQCNHDLGVLLRICSPANGDGALTPNQLEGLRNNLFEAIGDHEHYCATYSSKEQPHLSSRAPSPPTATHSLPPPTRPPT